MADLPDFFEETKIGIGEVVRPALVMTLRAGLDKAVQAGALSLDEYDLLVSEWKRLELVEARLLGQLSYERDPHQQQLIVEFLGYDPREGRE